MEQIELLNIVDFELQHTVFLYTCDLLIPKQRIQIVCPAKYFVLMDVVW